MTVSDHDLTEIGAAVLDLVGAAILMRHVSPAGTINYAEPSGLGQKIAWDFTAWVSRGTGCEEGERLSTFLDESGWLGEMIAALPSVEAAS